LWVVETLVEEEATRAKLNQLGWAYLNDASLMDLDEEEPINVACACLELASGDSGVSLPVKPKHWHQVAGGTLLAMERIVAKIDGVKV
jgi:hypothetical protein